MIKGYDPRLQSLLASLFTWGVTALGAALVFVLPAHNKTFLDVSLGFAAGVMTAASFWSLLAPAIEISETTMGSWAFLPVSLGFAVGALFVNFSDKLIPTCVVAEMSLISVITNECVDDALPTKGHDTDRASLTHADPRAAERYTMPGTELRQRKAASRMMLDSDDIELNDVGPVAEKRVEPKQPSAQHVMSWRRILLLIMAVTVHNIPEGLAVGVGFASVGKTPAATFEKAFNLALGIGLQNFPEGLAVSLPLAAFGVGKFKAFLCGQFSGMVEPFAAVLGSYALLLMEPALPYALSFAAGAMIYVVFDDIIPEAQMNGNGKHASAGAVFGFLVMMCMDVGLG